MNKSSAQITWQKWMYDIIGDIHGQAEKLKALLSLLGYKETAKGWQHPKYKVIFVGDFIDRGPQQLETLHIVKTMIDAGNAQAVMGNHELNAIGWLTPCPNQPGNFLRPHTAKNHKQHVAFLDQIGENTLQHSQWVEWFRQLPVFLDLGNIRVIHACWDSKAISLLKPFLDNKNRLRTPFFAEAFNPQHPLFNITETLIKGKEISLPEGVSYHDKDGTLRRNSRIKWWNKEAKTLKELCLLPEGQEQHFPDLPVSNYDTIYCEPQIVFFGHYWFTDTPEPVAENLACVDYSAAIASGKLVAYRWSGETVLSKQHFVYIK